MVCCVRCCWKVVVGTERKSKGAVHSHVLQTVLDRPLRTKLLLSVWQFVEYFGFLRDPNPKCCCTLFSCVPCLCAAALACFSYYYLFYTTTPRSLHTHRPYPSILSLVWKAIASRFLLLLVSFVRCCFCVTPLHSTPLHCCLYQSLLLSISINQYLSFFLPSLVAVVVRPTAARTTTT